MKKHITKAMTILPLLVIIALMLFLCSCGEKKEFTLTCTLAIDCTRVADSIDEAVVQENGFILPTSDCYFAEGDTALDVLRRTVKEKKIPSEIKDGYVVSIGSLETGEFGDMSGWLYYVNGIIPEIGAGEYRLTQNDEIVFVYFDNFNKAFE